KTGKPTQFPRDGDPVPPSARVYSCPATRKDSKISVKYALTGAAVTNIDARNMKLPEVPFPVFKIYSRAAGQVVLNSSPSKTAWVMESNFIWFRRTKNEYTQIDWRNNGGANVLFYDSHIQWMKKPTESELKEEKWLTFFGDLQ